MTFSSPKRFGPCDGGLLRVIVANESGGGDVQMASDIPPCPKVLYSPDGPPHHFPYHCTAEFTYRFWLLPGAYTVQARYRAEKQPDAPTAPYWTGSLSTDAVRFQVDDPQGEDLRALQAFNLAPGKTPVKSYVSFIQRNAQELLKRFPTSIYAGYVLRERGPSQVLWAISCLNDPDAELRKYSDMGGGEDNLQRRIAKTQAELQAYAKLAGPFLQAHSDFPYATMLRKNLAMCFGLTGHMPEAMAEIQVLSTGTGKEAEEAKAFLQGKEGAGQRKS